MDIIIGTAGHIDHGKTALVKALTGIDADRLPEEKRRGITIDLGFAELQMEGLRIGFVDVPGHERFVKNMLAGASGIDLVLLVIAADDGVMPQTREHFEICRLLETKAGLIVLTKRDLVDEEFLELVKLDVRELIEGSFLENSPIVEVSAKSGEGIENLKRVLGEIAGKVPVRLNETIARMPIDRSFSLKGFGAVVTGTLISGEIGETDEMELLPIRRIVRLRGLQIHGKPTKVARAGQRTAVNLGGIEYSGIERGMVLCEKDVLRETQIFDAEIELLKGARKNLKSRARVRVHLGTTEALARIQVLNETNEIERGAKELVQIRLEAPVVTIPGERFILRSYSPQATIAGGRVLDNHPIRHRRKDVEFVRGDLKVLVRAVSESGHAAQIKAYVDRANEFGLSIADLQARTGWRIEVLERAIGENIDRKFVIKAGAIHISRTAFENLKTKTLLELANYHKCEPIGRGLFRETLREKIFARISPDIFPTILTNLESERLIDSEKDTVRLASHRTELTGEEKTVYDRLSAIFRTSKFEVPKLDEALAEASRATRLNNDAARKVFQLLINSGEIVKVTADFYFSRVAVDEMAETLKRFAVNSSDRAIDVAAFKEMLKISRKYAIPLLEYCDREKITRRDGDRRLIL